MRKNVIVTDADQSFLIQLCSLLNRMGLNSIPTESGHDLIKLANIQKPDLIFMDIVMPNLDGLETIEHLKKSPSMRKVPVIAMSTDNSPKMIEAVTEQGAYDFLPKPLEIKRVHNILEELLFSDYRSQRAFIRTPYRGQITVSTDDAEARHYTESISEQGVYVITPEPLDIGSSIKTVLHTDEKDISFKGTVIYHCGMHSNEKAFPPGMAIKFDEDPNKDFEGLHELIKKQLTVDIKDFNKSPFI